jgi:hypothetical protein
MVRLVDISQLKPWHSMAIPKACPVCGNVKIERESGVGTPFVRGDICSRFITYRCDNGHVFLIEDDAQSNSQSN